MYAVFILGYRILCTTRVLSMYYKRKSVQSVSQSSVFPVIDDRMRKQQIRSVAATISDKTVTLLQCPLLRIYFFRPGLCLYT